ncbi:hypothetical protein HMPREF2693_00325 [Staphylococcus sp. HMSC068D08]|uniref:hypothetical protein n=1 Tax=Staphylococcus TaxID=1279 RepID=UPI0008A47A37|nr:MULTISPECIES: hypothetical protein [Staphylococcus]MCI2760836.1 hypothetical protein [Staphylococcus lugdunensis]MCI2794914.1 hypothetical protein [Staphylococcus lugdunensis]MCI2797202.1 hypothetical protein [Staphylococcus lugdunensis]MDU1964185.1 hypothetical protein [Staphylococcus lugdunensis]OFM44918.1 hypothetical protein HMPREF2693_00325 [Staphylococcus sp. HMSC068D08]
MDRTEVSIRPNEFAKAYIQTLKVDEKKFDNSEDRVEYFKNEYLQALKVITDYALNHQFE